MPGDSAEFDSYDQALPRCLHRLLHAFGYHADYLSRLQQLWVDARLIRAVDGHEGGSPLSSQLSESYQHTHHLNQPDTSRTHGTTRGGVSWTYGGVSLVSFTYLTTTDVQDHQQLIPLPRPILSPVRPPQAFPSASASHAAYARSLCTHLGTRPGSTSYPM